MLPTRQKLIGERRVEEWNYNFYFLPKPRKIVTINGKQVGETYDQAVARLERELGGQVMEKTIYIKQNNPGDDNLWMCKECKGMWGFLEGGPRYNRMEYCPYCGRKIEEEAR